MDKVTTAVLKGLLSSSVVASLILTHGCATRFQADPQYDPVRDEAAAQDYKIAPGDILEISVFGEEGLRQQDLVVKPDGRISFPLVGDVQVGGATTEQVKDAVEQKVHEYIPEAVANVSVRQLGSMQYYVTGKVAKPGMYNVARPVTVLQAMALAGGLTTFADEKKVQIVRNKDGKVINLPFNYKDVKKGRNLEQNIVLERGDTVVVP